MPASFGDEELHDFLLGIHLGDFVSRVPILVLQGGVSTSIDQHLDRFQLPVPRRVVQRGVVLRVCDVEVRFGVDQHLGALQLTVPAGEVQARAALVVNLVLVSFLMKQLPQRVGVPQLRGLPRVVHDHLFVLFRSATTHDLDNDALDRPLHQMVQVVNQQFERGADQLEIAMMDGNFFVNGRLLQLDYSTFQNTRYLRRIFEFLKVDVLTITTPPDEPILRQLLKAFLKVIRDPTKNIQDFDLAPIHLSVRRSTGYEELFGLNDPRHHVLGVYASGLLMLRQFVNDLRKGQAPRYPKIKRLCLQLIDLEPRYHSLLVALIHLEGYKGNLFCRMLNTAVMSIAFGHRIGLNRDQLLDLGMTAFYHDLGWALVGTLNDEEVSDIALTIDGINRARNSSEDSMEHLRVKVARALVRIGGFNELVINRLIVAYETQIPQERPPEGLYYGEIGASYMTHVIRMASRYDELTTKSDKTRAFHPDEAMRVILDNDGSTYEPFLSNLFANSIGAFPVGSFVELDTGEVGLVVNLPVEPVHFNRPQVKLLMNRSGTAVSDGPVLDLSEQDRTGRFLRSIERTYDGRAFGISITNFFFGDATD